MRTVELLAPAKNLETAIAAINSGADAIYIGASDFGARVNASNSLESIEKLVNYAHKFYVRVHVTINTILNNFELKNAVNLVKNLYNIGVDAIIVQDMGLINEAVKGNLPPIQIHASTQCDNRTLEKAKFFDAIGVSRVILARELAIDKIKEICDKTNCEIETFVHGALCVSYSGQCYMSYANGGRSANRGECAQPCRKQYSLVNEYGKVLLNNKYLLSMKDFNASESVEKLINCGVKSFKIEGRLKDVNYVKNVVLYYNSLLNKYASRTSSGVVFTEFEPNLSKTFNRGYTDYFLNGRKDCYNFVSPKFTGEFVGVVNKVGKDYFETDAVLAFQDGLSFMIKGDIYGCLVNKIKGNRVYPNKMDNICTGLKLYRNYDVSFDKAIKNAKISRKIRTELTINENNIYACDEDSNKVSIQIPAGDTAKNPEKLKETYVKQLSKSGDSDFYVSNVKVFGNLPFLPVANINEIRRELLSLLMSERLKNYKKLPQKPIGYTKFIADKIDYRGNVFNDSAKEFYQNCGCECEPALESRANIPSGVELMRTKHCLKFAAGVCGKNVGKLYLQDEKGKKYPLLFDCKNCEMAILNP